MGKYGHIQYLRPNRKWESSTTMYVSLFHLHPFQKNGTGLKKTLLLTLKMEASLRKPEAVFKLCNHQQAIVAMH